MMLHEHPDGVMVEAWVVPGASRTEVAGVHDGALRLRVAAPAAAGAANAAAVWLLGGVVGRCELVAGTASRRKRFLVTGVTLEEVRRKLAELGIAGS
jgi:uncharacterized protein (TIGR00251 family)